jgi:hypothetical protein
MHAITLKTDYHFGELIQYMYRLKRRHMRALVLTWR